MWCFWNGFTLKSKNNSKSQNHLQNSSSSIIFGRNWKFFDLFVLCKKLFFFSSLNFHLTLHTHNQFEILHTVLFFERFLLIEWFVFFEWFLFIKWVFLYFLLFCLRITFILPIKLHNFYRELTMKIHRKSIDTNSTHPLDSNAMEYTR